MDQFCRRGLFTFGIAGVPAILDPDVAAIGPAEPLERIEERRDASLTFSIGLRVIRDQHADPPGLLRARSEWPSRRRAAEGGYKFPPSDGSCHLSPPFGGRP